MTTYSYGDRIDRSEKFIRATPRPDGSIDPQCIPLHYRAHLVQALGRRAERDVSCDISLRFTLIGHDEGPSLTLQAICRL